MLIPVMTIPRLDRITVWINYQLKNVKYHPLGPLRTRRNMAEICEVTPWTDCSQLVKQLLAALTVYVRTYRSSSQ